MTPQINTDRIAELRSEIEAFSSRFHDQHGKNYWWSHVLAITLILAGFFVAAAGFLGHAKVAGFLGLVVGALQAISQRFNLEEKADFLLIIASSADVDSTAEV